MFIVSILFVIISSYLILSCISGNSERVRGGAVAHAATDRNAKTGFLYFLLIAFSQIVLSFEILSLFKAISKTGFLICNIAFVAISIILFLKKGKPFYIPQFETQKILKALKQDKILLFLSICFCFFLIFQLIQILFFPVTFGDALAYYFPRCTSWIQNGSILHYITPDSRELIMPVNMEFLYTWLLLFQKSETGIAVFSFISFIGAVYVLYNLLKELKFGIKRRLWAVFVFSSFALVGIESVTPCADLFIGALILASIYLFIKAAKYCEHKMPNEKNFGNHRQCKIYLYFSSLAYALAVGTKTTAIIAIPSVFLIFCVITFLYRKETFWKHIFTFGGLFLLNFLIFSSYNYILNVIQFANPVSCSEQLLLNQFRDGTKGWITNVIKYSFTIFDMSGMPRFININGLVEYWQSLVFSFFGVTAKTGISNYFPGSFIFNNEMSLVSSSLGAMGLFAFLPSLIYAVKRGLKNKISKTSLIMAVLACSIIFNILLFSRVMLFTAYNMRYILTFVIIASPVIAYSYPLKKRKICKCFLCLIMFIYLIGCTHQKPVSYILTCFKYQKIIKTFTNDEENLIYKYFMNKPKVNIAIFCEQAKNPIYNIEKLKLYGYHIDKLLAENIEDYNLNKYDYIIMRGIIDQNPKVTSTYIVNFENRMKYKYLYAAHCWYNDYKQNTIYNVEKDIKPAMIACEIPLDYIKENGFAKARDYEGKKYTILQKIK